jgi:hypothetical protein
MKTEPISNSERGTIIAQLAKLGKWEGTRKGALVRIVRYQSPHGCIIRYSVTMGFRNVTAAAPTVYAAVGECNSIIRGRLPQAMAGRVADPHRTGTPHLVRRRNVEPAGESLLGEA